MEGIFILDLRRNILIEKEEEGGVAGITALKLNGPWVPKMAHFDRGAPGHVSLTPGRMQIKGISPLSGLCI